MAEDQERLINNISKAKAIFSLLGPARDITSDILNDMIPLSVIF